MTSTPRLLLAALVAALLPAATPAQSPFRPQDPVFGTKPAAGSREGTERWIVHFANRPFTLDALRAEYRSGADPAKVGKLVADLEQRMTAHQAAFVQEVEKLGGRMLRQFWIINACAIEIEPKHLGTVRDLANVAFLQPDALCEQSGPVAPIKTATNASNHHADELQAKGVTGAGIAIAICDSGHDVNMNGTGKPHITYSDRGSTTATRLLFDKQIGLMSADDVSGHGTAVGSCAAGWAWNSVNGDHGQALDAKIAGYAMADFANGNAFSTTQTAAWQTVLADAAANKVKVGNMSYAGSPSAIDATQQAIDTVVLTADLLVCTAAGNSGTNITGSCVTLNGLSVGAVNAGTHTLATFSGTGFMTDGGTFPDIVANGVALNMALRDNEAGDNANSGTSFASPLVAGAAVLIRAANPALQANETKAILLASTEASAGTLGVQAQGVGCGYLRDDVAYQIAMNPYCYGHSVVSAAAPKVSWPLRVKNGQVVQVAIAWNRMDVTKAAFSDLDLVLLRGNTILVNSNSGPNSEEFVRFTATADETLTVEVNAFAIRNTTQQEFAWATNIDNGSKVIPAFLSGASFGSSLASAGDFNKDGYEDYVIGHSGATVTGNANAGSVHVVSGKDYANLTGGGLAGPSVNRRFGTSVAGADMDLDGFSDVVFGAPGLGTQGGAIWVLSGATVSASNFVTSASPGLGELLTVARYLDADGYPDVVAVDTANTALVAFSGRTKAELWRKTPVAGVAIRSLATIGDVDGDGLDDLVIGLPAFNGNFGRVMVISGRTGNTIRIQDGAVVEALGASVAGIGDVDGDGVPDYLFGSPDHANGGIKRGRAAVQSGRTGAFLLFLGGSIDNGGLGYAVASARGDLDGDGVPDFLVSSVQTGMVQAFSGKDAHLLRTWNGPSATFGAAIAGVLASGDDRPDLIVAEPGFGRVTIFDSATVANPPAYSEYGVPCARSNGAYPHCVFTGVPARVGGSTTVGLVTGPPSAPTALQVGGVRSAIDLGPLGLPGCQSLVNPVVTVSGATNSLGQQSLKLAIPLALDLVGGSVHFQWLCVDAAKTPFPLALSTGGTVRIGSQF